MLIEDERSYILDIYELDVGDLVEVFSKFDKQTLLLYIFQKNEKEVKFRRFQKSYFFRFNNEKWTFEEYDSYGKPSWDKKQFIVKLHKIKNKGL